MIFYPVGTLRWLRFSTKTQTPIAKRARQISRPSENFVSDISVVGPPDKFDLPFCFRHGLHIGFLHANSIPIQLYEMCNQ